MSLLEEITSTHHTRQVQAWAIFRKDGGRVLITSASQTLEVEGQRFSPARGLIAQESETSSAGGEGGTGAKGVLDSELATYEDFLAGRLSGAIVLEWIVDERAPWVILEYNRYDLREQNLDGSQFELQLSNRSRRLAGDIGERLSRQCQKKLGDPFTCKADIVPSSVFGEPITEVESVTRFRCSGISGKRPDGWFDWGEMSVVTEVGAAQRNRGQENMVLQSYQNGSIRLLRPLPFMPEVGDRVHLWVGCNRLESDCGGKHLNLENYGGATDIPGPDSAITPAS